MATQIQNERRVGQQQLDTFTVSDDEVRLLLELVQEHAVSLESADALRSYG